MDVFEAIKGRRSCLKFIEYPVEREKIIKMLGCAIYAPSPANKQPWEFIVTNNMRYNQMLKKVAESTKEKLAARSGWKWLATFNINFITEAPILIVVVGDPKQHGAEQFLDAPFMIYRKNQYLETIKAFDKAIILDPNNTVAWVGKSLALNALGRTAEADAAFAKAKELGYSG